MYSETMTCHKQRNRGSFEKCNEPEKLQCLIWKCALLGLFIGLLTIQGNCSNVLCTLHSFTYSLINMLKINTNNHHMNQLPHHHFESLFCHCSSLYLLSGILGGWSCGLKTVCCSAADLGIICFCISSSDSAGKTPPDLLVPPQLI